MGSLGIATLLLLLAIGILLLDVFVPSGGVLIFISALCGLTSILFAFRHSSSVGLWFVILLLGALPVILFLFVKVWPETAIGKRVRMGLPEQQEIAWSVGEVGDIRAMIGQQGLTVTELMPIGVVQVGQAQFEARTDGEPIPRGQLVQVLRVDMGALVVGPWDFHSSQPPAIPPALAATNSAIASESSSLASGDEDLLSRSIEEIGIDAIDPHYRP